MNENTPTGPVSQDALVAIEANFDRVRQMTIQQGELWLLANDAVATREALYDASFLLRDQSYHAQLRVTFSRGHHLMDVRLSWRISAEFQVVEGPVVLDLTEERAADGGRTVERGVITSVVDCGTIVQLVIDTDDDVLVLTADGNLLRRAEAECGSLDGLGVEFNRNDWNGLEWFAPLD